MRQLALAVCLVACGSRATPPTATAQGEGLSIAMYRADDTAYGVVDDRRWIDIQGSSIILGNIDPGAELASLVIETPSPAVRIGPCTRERLPDERDLQKSDTSEAYARELQRIKAEEARRMREREQRRVPRRYRDEDYVERPRVREKPEVVPRDRFAPVVQCDVTGTPGRYLVRIVYVSTQLRYRVQHDIALATSGTARIESRFAVRTPPWRARAELVLFHGVPGGVEPPREITRGMTTLDGGTSVLAVPSREVPAQLRRIFEGMPYDDSGDDDYKLDTLAVWATLELPDVELVPGPTRVHIEGDGDDRWIDVPEPRRPRSDDDKREQRAGEPLRMKLWIDSTLRGGRQRMIVDNDGQRMIEVVALSVTNIGDEPREVWLEEYARPAKRRSIERAWPTTPSARGDRIRNKVVVQPGKVGRAGYSIVYEL